MCHSGDTSCISVIQGVIRDGIAAGDLELQSGCTPEGLTFGLWSMAVGARMLMVHGVLMDKFGEEEPRVVLNQNYQLFIDGYNWRPLSMEWDYTRTIERVRQEVFAEDIRKAGI